MNKILKNIFSVVNVESHNNKIYKVFTIFGVKIKIFNKFKTLCRNINNIKDEINQCSTNVEVINVKNNRFNKFLWNGIIDSSPDSFKKYFLTNNMLEKISKLKIGLDKKSKKLIDKTLLKILQLPDYKYAEYLYTKEHDFILRFSTQEDLEYCKLEKKYLPQSKIEFKLAKDDYDSEVFIYHHGLRFANDKLKYYIEGKTFIDAGAYIGDSALVLLKYNPLNIHSFDISLKSVNDYKKTMEINNIPNDKYVINQLALTDNESDFIVDDNGGMSVKIFNEIGNLVKSTTLDTYVESNNLNIGFIKADIEGSMFKALLGMKKTIRSYRPVLSFAIYHSPEEFFETKPLLDEIVSDLNYTIKIDCHYSSCMHIYGTIIWAYPKEFEE